MDDHSPQELRARAAELQQRASAIERANQLRSQATSLTAQADQIEQSIAPMSIAQPIAVIECGGPAPASSDDQQDDHMSRLRAIAPYHPSLPENQLSAAAATAQ